jgi:hypothetical protein
MKRLELTKTGSKFAKEIHRLGDRSVRSDAGNGGQNCGGGDARAKITA